MINWIYFFHAWGFQPKFAAIADIHGCDSCRAMWLTGFAEEDRPKASEAMQLFKEANRMLNELDTAYQTHGVVNIMDAQSHSDINTGHLLSILLFVDAKAENACCSAADHLRRHWHP